MRTFTAKTVRTLANFQALNHSLAAYEPVDTLNDVLQASDRAGHVQIRGDGGPSIRDHTKSGGQWFLSCSRRAAVASISSSPSATTTP